MATKNLGSISVKGYRFYSGGWSSTTYSSLTASYSGPNASGVWYATVDKITLPSFTNSKYQQPYSISLSVPILKGSSSSPASGSLYAYLYSSDPGGSSRYSTTPAANSPPSGHIGYGSVGYSGLTQNNKNFTVTININNTDLSSGGSYYVWLKTSTYTQIHYGGVAPTGSLTGTEVPSTYTISYNKNCDASQTVELLPSTETVTAGSTYSISSEVPWKYDAAMFGYGTSSTAFDYYPGDQIENVTANKTLYCRWESAWDSLVENGSVTPAFYFPKQRRVYVFKPTVTRKYKINAPVNTTGATDPDIYLYKDSNTHLVRSANADKTSESMTYTLNAGTNYYIHVRVDTPGFSSGCTTKLNLHAIYNITYNANGGSGAPSAQEQEYGTTISLSTTAPTWENHTFKGWATSSSSTVVSYEKGDSYSGNADLNLYAVWEENAKTLTINSDNKANISESGGKAYYLFTAPSSKKYVIRSYHTNSQNGYDPKVYLYNGSGTQQLGYEDDKGDGWNFRLEYSFTKGKTYMFEMYFRESSATGELPFKFGEIYSITYETNTTDSVSDMPSNGTKDYGFNYYIPDVIPTRTGYTFKGWGINKTSVINGPPSMGYGGYYSDNKNLTYYAIWEPKKYTVTYYSSGTQIQKITDITYGTSISVRGTSGLGNTTPLEYSTSYTIDLNSNGGNAVDDKTCTTTFTPYFNGWQLNSSNSIYAVGSSYTVTADTIFNADWQYTETTSTIQLGSATRNSQSSSGYTVQFNTKGGNTIASKSATDITSYAFKGWGTTSSTTTVSYTSTRYYSFTENKTLYAIWTPTTTKGSITLPISTEVYKTGYELQGWTLTDGSSIISYLPGGSYTPNGNNKTLYAIWKGEVYDITLNHAGGTNTIDNLWFQYNLGWADSSSLIIKSINPPTRTGYIFNGYYYGTTQITDASGNFVASNTWTTRSCTITAKWTPITYTINFNNGIYTEILNSTKLTQNFTYDQAQKLYSGQFKRQHTIQYVLDGGTGQISSTTTFVFNGWQDGNGTTYSNEQSVKNLTTTNGATLNFYPQWSVEKISLHTPTKTGHVFIGWYDANDNKIGDGGSEYEITTNTTLYAKWKAKTLTVRFYRNSPDGSATAQYTQIYTYGDTHKQFGYDSNGNKLNAQAANSHADLYGYRAWSFPGYKIIGWNMNSTSTTATYDTYYTVTDDFINSRISSTGTGSGSMTVYAIWDHNGLVRVYYNNEWRMAIPYVYNGTSWKQALPYVYDKKDGSENEYEWKLGI